MYAAGFQCAGCGEWIETSVDESAGSKQQYVEDCQCVLPAERADGAMGRVGEGVFDCGRAGELKRRECLCPIGSSKDNKAEFGRVRCGPVRPESGDELANGWPLPYNQNFA